MRDFQVSESTIHPIDHDDFWYKFCVMRRGYVYGCTNSVPSHKDMTTQDWMSENLHDHITLNIWPPSSPDLNPLDYYVQGVVERETNKHPQKTLDSLRAAITRVMTHMDEDHLQTFLPRTESVIAAEGDFIK